MKLKAKLISFFVAVAVISFIPVALLGYSFIRNQAERDIHDKLAATSSGVAGQLNGWINENAKVVETIGLVLNKAETKEDITAAHLQALKAETNAKNISDIYVGLEDGRFIDGSGWVPDEGYDPRSRGWYQGVKANPEKGLYFSDPYLDKVTNKYAVSIGYPLLDKEGKLYGVVSEDILLDTLTNMVNELELGGIGQGFLLDANGIVLAHADKELINTDFKESTRYKELAEKIKSGTMGRIDFTVNGVGKMIEYTRIPSTNWIFALEADNAVVFKDILGLRNNYYLISIITLLVVVLLAFLVAHSVTRPVKKFRDAIETAGKNKDLTISFETKARDEIGDMARSFNAFTENIRLSFKSVLEVTKTVESDVNEIAGNIDRLNSNVEDVSATTEELSAGMEETAASSQEMTASTCQIENAVGEIASKAQEGARTAAEISERAEELKVTARNSQAAAQEIGVAVNEKLREAIEKSNAVAEISTLTDGILDITSQTNLLALNAAIEAARAGEAGKGFAVVADEIRKLADDSKHTVVRIQEVTRTVIEAVENLKSNSGQVLEFIESRVSNDYRRMVDTGEQYSKDASMINELVMDFSATSQELLASVQDISKAIGDVTRAAGEGAEGTENIAQKTSDIASMTELVTRQAENTQNSVQKLHYLMSQFKM